MTGWPTWLIGIAVLVFIVVAVIFIFYWSLADGMQRPWGNGEIPKLRRRKHDKK